MDNELTVEVVKLPNMPLIYAIKRGRETLATQASYPSAEDVAATLQRWRERGTTQEESSRLAQLRKPHRMGKWTGDNDPEAA